MVAFIRLPQVLESTGLKRSTLFAHIAAGKFPHQVKLGARASGWVKDEVEEWAAARINESRPASAGSSSAPK
jgi:prophage regulatory protein